MIRGATRGEPTGESPLTPVLRSAPMARRLLVLLAFAVLLAGCGSSSDESVGGLLKDTFAGGKSVKSGKLNVQLDANLQGVQSLNGPVRLKVSGPFQSTGSNELPKFDFTLSITSNGQ